MQGGDIGKCRRRPRAPGCGGDGELTRSCGLQTFGSAGARERDGRLARLTNIRLPWSRERDGRLARPTNIRLRWSREQGGRILRPTNIRLRWSRERDARLALATNIRPPGAENRVEESCGLQ